MACAFYDPLIRMAMDTFNTNNNTKFYSTESSYNQYNIPTSLLLIVLTLTFIVLKTYKELKKLEKRISFIEHILVMHFVNNSQDPACKYDFKMLPLIDNLVAITSTDMDE